MRLDRFQDNIFYHEVETPSYPLMEFNQYTLALAGKILDVAKYEQLDVVHVHYAIPHAISAYLAKEISQTTRPLKLVTTLHGTDITLVGMEPTWLRLSLGFCRRRHGRASETILISRLSQTLLTPRYTSATRTLL
jgi:hypothetical protein